MDEDDILREAGEALIEKANEMAAQEDYQDTLGMALKQGFRELMGVVFSQDLDFLTKLMIVVTGFSFILMVVYLVVPMSCRRKIEKIDFNHEFGGLISYTGALAIFFTAAMGVQKMNKMGFSKSAE